MNQYIISKQLPFILLFTTIFFGQSQKPSYKDSSLLIEVRVSDLLSRMTVEEKIGQMAQPFGWKSWKRNGKKIVITDEFKNQINNLKIGAYYGTLRVDPWTGVTLEEGLYGEEIPETANLLQKYNLEHSRLGIPLLFNEDTTHGMMTIGSTVFPVTLAVASTWNKDLAEKMYATMAKEVRATGANWVCSPNLDVVRDPRWGRIEETYGEDPYLCAQMGVASINGFQGEGINSDHTVATTIKHFVQSLPEGGHNAGFVNMGDRELHEVYLYPFKKGVEAGSSSLMAAYADVNGVPCNKSHDLLTKILRDEWKFNGMVVSDAYSVSQLANYHMVSEDLAHASADVVKAGLDMDMSADAFQNGLHKALEHGLLSIPDIDIAVRRILRLKFELGLFENPYVKADNLKKVYNTDENKEVAREVARQAMVLLKNENQILPLKKEYKSIAIIGPNADNIMNQLGDYTSPQKRDWVVTVLDGLKKKLSPNTIITYEKGCDIRNPSKEGFAKAIEAAENAELVIAVIGGSSNRLYDPDSVDKNTGQAQINKGVFTDMDCGEGFDRTDLGLSGVQADLIAELKATGRPIVTVLINGRPLSIPKVMEDSNAVLEAWYCGAQGGHAVADILFGDYNPSGHLPVSVAKDVGQLPVFYSHRKKNRKSYLEMDAEPLFPFGFGLSYTSFEYNDLELSSEKIKSSDSIKVSIKVKNTGKVAGADVVQLYLRDVVGSVSRPNMILRGFDKIFLEPNETKKIDFILSPDDLAMYDINMDWKVEPGIFEVLIGASSKDIRQKKNFEVVN